MKIICDCGNEVIFNKVDPDTGKLFEVDEDEGQYVTVDWEKFSTWEKHDVIGIICEKCKQAVWWFC